MATETLHFENARIAQQLFSNDLRNLQMLDDELEAQLLADPKENAEHVMLVDLARNDLGRVSEYGSVKVKDLMYVERYSHVMHIVSALEGKLRGDLDALDAFAACFPACQAPFRMSPHHRPQFSYGRNSASTSSSSPKKLATM